MECNSDKKYRTTRNNSKVMSFSTEFEASRFIVGVHGTSLWSIMVYYSPLFVGPMGFGAF
jgi:hypothetical protein